MTHKELRKLGRAELLEIMYELKRQLDEALQENEKLCAELSELRSSLTAQTNKMVSRLYEDRFGEPFEFKEPYIDAPSKGVCDIKLPYQVPENRVFVMGDHRSNSIDSRTKEIGCVAEEMIVGKVIWCIYPLGDMKIL